ncbi:MAG TPA: MBL fold metallo-hydrolase, partial [Polyangia bacterium]|nr:MBL fold metallo-hydrolase [Polyangia bacterium]
MTSVQRCFRPAREPRISLKNGGALEVVFLGVGSAFATTLFQSNIFLIKGETHVMLDLGSKASIALNEAGIGVLDIENLVATHSHADHIGGIEEWCLKARYSAPLVKGCARGEYRPNLLTTADYAHILWDGSLRGGLEHSEETQPGKRLCLSDYVTLRFGEYLAGYGRPVYQLEVGEGRHAINLKLMRTNHIPDSSTGWQTAFYSVGVLVDDRVFISGDTMFDRELAEVFGSRAEAIFHDCQDYTGGVHASYDDLQGLAPRLKEKMLLYHLPDGFQEQVDPVQTGFAGWTRCFRSG